MIRAFLSRYRPRYVRSLAYMLQSTEYNLGDYIAWFNRTRDFSRVEKRGTLKKTAKVYLVLLVIWAFALILFFLSILLARAFTSLTELVVFIIALLFLPYVLGYLITVPLYLVRVVIQQPIEAYIIAKAKSKLAAHKGYKIAVAGSFGKTSMREILRTTLAEGKTVAAPPKSYNTPLGLSKFIMGLRGDEDVLIFELGEYFRGDIKKLCRLVNPDLGVITGVNQAHLSKFKRLDQTAATIFELADALPKGPVYVNGGSDLAKSLARKGHILYSAAGAGGWRADNLKTGLAGTSFDLKSAHQTIHVKSHLLGLHQVGPLSAAADIATQLGLTPAQVQAGLSKVKPFDHRLEPKTDSAGVTTLDDSYNGNPDGAAAVIAFLGSLRGHRRLYVTPGLVEMGPQTKSVHEQIGRQLAGAGIDQVILVRNSVTSYIADGLKQAGYTGQLTWFETGPQAILALPSLTKSGDVVLLQNDWPDQYA
jgi:UDP-N-acetylmuramoyl-tripeptide--D-alanyl-D-alanine ligase